MLFTVATGIWLYRLVYNWQGLRRIKINITAMVNWMVRKVRPGLPALLSVSRERAKQITLKGPKDGPKTPWGW
jgi:hypothetical protein